MKPHRPLPVRRALSAALALLTCAVARAGVTVTQNTGPGATSWPGTPLLSTVSNPASQLIVGESFGGATSYTQTFTIPAPNNYTLQTICLYAGGGSGTSATATLRVNLFDLGGRIAPNPSSYAPGVNLLGGGSGLPITYTYQPNGVLRLDFSGADNVQLLAGHMYAFELAGVSGTTPMNWIRTTADTFAGGAAYRNRSWINGSNARDFGLALYGPINTDPVPPAECTVNGGVTRQQIDGFGAGAVFLDAGLDPLTDAWMDALFGTGTNQMGLTLIRLRISPYHDWNTAILDGQKAHQRGVRILATPWTPPAAMKDNNNTVHGSLLPSQYGAFVDWLNEFTDTMAANGAPVSVVSVQNEPDFDPDYEGCTWTAAQFQTFFRDFAGGIKAPVMMPESFSFNQAVSNATLNDPAAAANVDVVGGHLYGATIQDYPLAHALGKHTWMTEFLVNDQTIASAIETGRQISDCLSVANMSAYIWWKTIGNANGLLNASGVLQRRAYVMAQFSRFVRPGDFRVDVGSNTGPMGISAFRDPVSGRFAIVAVNSTTVAVPQRFTVTGLAASSVTPWVTSASQSLEPQSPVALGAGVFEYTLAPLSIVTFAGTETPVITNDPAASATYGEAFSLQITATHAPDLYAATGLPPGLSIDPATGLISGTPGAAGDYLATVTASNAGGSDTLELALTVVKANASITLAGLSSLYDGTPRSVTAATNPGGLTVVLAYNGQPEAPILPGVYTVVASIDDPNHVGSTTATLVVDITAQVRHFSALDGGLDGSIQVLTAEDATLNGKAWVSGDLLVPGSPEMRINGHPTFGGVLDTTGAAEPALQTVTLNGGAVLRHLVRRVDPLSLPVVSAPPQPTGSRSVVLNRPGDSAGDFSTLRDLTLNGAAGQVALPPGTYGSITVNGTSGLILGIAGGTEPAAYNLQALTLNGRCRIELAGPVVLTLAQGLSIPSGVTVSDHPVDGLSLRLASGGLTLDGKGSFVASVTAPGGAVTLNGSAALRGLVKADRLIVNGNAVLETP